jgi:lysophospholipase L1-like esterase
MPVTGAYQTIIKFSPNSNSTSQGFCIYLVGVLDGSTVRFYSAYSINNQNPDDLMWYELGHDNDHLKRIGFVTLRIAFIGDSIIEGYGSSDYNGGEDGTSGHEIPNNVKTWYRNTGSNCWVNKMIAYLTDKYSNVIAVNNGIGGFSAWAVYNNLDTLTKDDNGNRVNVAVISVGTNNRNDSNKETELIQPLTKTILWCKQRGIQPIVLTNTPIIGVSAPNNAETVQSCIMTACDRAGIRCYPLLSKINKYMWENNIPLEANTDQSKFMHDYLHPADPGYAIMFELIKELFNV